MVQDIDFGRYYVLLTRQQQLNRTGHHAYIDATKAWGR